MHALRDREGWDLKTLNRLPYMTLVRRLEAEFIRPVVGDQEINISPFVREFAGPDAHIDCSMSDESGSVASRCHMVVAYVDKRTNQSADWRSDVAAVFFEK